MPLPKEEFEKRKTSLVERGKQIYEERLKKLLEPAHQGEFLTIEPETGRYFLGQTRSSVIETASEAMPNDIFYMVRVGYDAAYNIGSHATKTSR